jgi:hypothetical protein
MAMQKNSVNNIQNPTPPNLPIAPVEYSQAFQDQLSNVLRLYFNQVNNSLNGLVLPILPSSSTGLRSGSFWYDPADGNRVKYVP